MTKNQNTENRSAEFLGLAAILVLAAWLRVWHVERNGFGNDYYAAAVRSMLQSWHNFFFVSFDPAGWVTVDKPPLALWIQAACAKAFGFSKLSLLLPQAAEGVAGVYILYALVRRAFDANAALVAALALALMPVSVAVDRYNNVDACLVFVLLLAAYALSRAVEHGGRAWLLAAAGLLGLGFNTKMLAAFTILPMVGALYLLAAPGTLLHRTKRFLLAALALGVVSFSWVAVVDLTPANQRPYVGSTQDNSMLGLTLGWNGLQRFTGRRHEPENETPTAMAADTATPPVKSATPPRTPDEAAAVRGQAGGFGRNGMGAGPPGPTRLAQAVMAGQVLWFLPLALLGLCAAAERGAKPAKPSARKGPSRRPGASVRSRLAAFPGRARAALADRPDRQALFLWAGWLALCAVVLSALRTMHTYYLVLLAPPMAALCGIGVRALWLSYRDGRRDLLPLALLLTALWQASTLLQTPDWSGAFLPLLAGGACIAALLLTLAPGLSGPLPGLRWPRVGLATGLLALVVCPLGWALTPVLSPTGDNAVQADPTLITGVPANTVGARMFGAGRQNMGVDLRLLAFLQKNRGRTRYLVAALNSQSVGPLIIASGEPAIAVGGFMGGDPIVTADQFAAKVHAGELRYFLLNSPGPLIPGSGGRHADRGQGLWGGGRGIESQKLENWVRKHGRPVDPRLWRTPQPKPLYQTADGGGGFRGRRLGTLQLYDLNPGLGVRHKTS